MSVTIPKRYRPVVVRQGPGVYFVTWMGFTIATAPTLSQGKSVARALLRLLLPLAKCSNVNLSGLTLAYYVWLLAASLPTSGILPNVVPSSPVVIPGPVSVRARLALGPLRVRDTNPPAMVALPALDAVPGPGGAPPELRFRAVESESPGGGEFTSAPNRPVEEQVRDAGVRAFQEWYFTRDPVANAFRDFLSR